MGDPASTVTSEKMFDEENTSFFNKHKGLTQELFGYARRRKRLAVGCLLLVAFQFFFVTAFLVSPVSPLNACPALSLSLSLCLSAGGSAD